MATEVITKTTINRLRRRAKRGESREVRDLIQAGLSIRLTGRRLSWYCRFSTPAVAPDGQKSRTAHPICSVDACPDPVRMRQVVAAGRAALQDGRDPLAAIRTALAQALKLPETRVAGAPSISTWDFDTFRKEFKNDPPSWLRGPTAESYYKAMSRKQIGNMYDKRLVEITPQDIRDVRDSIRARGKIRQAALTVQALKTAFEWAAESDRSRYSGLTEDTNPAAEVTTKQRKRKRTKEDAIAAAKRVTINADGNIVIDNPKLPTTEDLGKLLYLLLDPNALPHVRRATLLLLLFSAQRRLTVASALRKAILRLPQHACGVWVLDGGTTKGGTPHILPFADIAGGVIASWITSLPKTGDWLFPGMPTRKKPVPNGHIDVRTVNEWFYEACVQAGCSRRYSPHTVRKAFNTYLSLRGASLADRKLILHHSEGHAGDVTEVHYNLDPKFEPKRKVIAIWNAFLGECLAQQSQTADLTSKILRNETTMKMAISNADQIERNRTQDYVDGSRINRSEEIKIEQAVDSADKTRFDLQPTQHYLSPAIAASPTQKSLSTDPTQLKTLRAKLKAREEFDDAVAKTSRRANRKPID